MPKKPFEIPLDGKLNTADNPLVIGKNFSSLKNYRYDESGLKGVSGMSQQHSYQMDSTQRRVQNAIHFNKFSPAAESHIIAQTVTASDTAPVIVNNETAIPSTTTHLWGSATPATTANGGLLYTEDTSAGVAYFSEAPNGQLVCCDGKESLIWGGDQMKLAGFLTSTATITTALTNPKDETNKINNASTESDEIVYLGNNIDAYVVLLLHGDGAEGGTTFTDSSPATAHTPVGVANAQTTLTLKKFGSASILLDGTGDYLTIPDDADFNWSGDHIFTVDCWVRRNTATLGTIFSHSLNATPTADFCQLYITAAGVLTWKVVNGSSEQEQTKGTIPVGTWTHIAVVCNGTSYWVYVNGKYDGGSKTQDLQDYDYANFLIGVNWTGSMEDEFDGAIDEFRISKGIARWGAANFTPQNRAYSDDPNDFLVGSPRPLQGMKVYIPSGGANTITAALTMKEWNGASWSAVTITDGTISPAGVALGQTGSITWDSTVDTSKPIYFEGRYLYFYNFVLSAGNAQIYQITLDAAMQKCLDLWDGQLRPIYSFLIFKTPNYLDNTVNVSDNGFDSTNTATFAELDGVASATDYLYVGSLVSLTGLQISMLDSQVNTTADANIDLIEYWDGTTWVSVTNVIDGTLEAGESLAKSGIITWESPDDFLEHKKTVAGSIPLYYYRISLDGDISSNCDVYYMAGIPTQQKIENWRYPMIADGCLWLLDNVDGDRNEVRRSKLNSPEVMNGSDSIRFPIGDGKKLTCGCVVSVRQEDKLSDIKLFFKNNEVWGLSGYLQNYSLFNISNTIGCPAPLTLKTTMIDIEGRSVPCAIWQGAKGIYAWFGGEPYPLHWDIRNIFNENESATRYINKSYIHTSSAFVDEEKREYHLLFGDSTSSGNMTKELVLDLTNLKWFEIARGIDVGGNKKFIQVGMSVEDLQGYTYTYGFIDAGYMYRLEYGNDFDTVDIAHEALLGWFNFLDPNLQTTVIFANLLMKAKATEDANATLTHYGDGNSTASTSTSTFTPTKSGYSFVGVGNEQNRQSWGPHAYHRFKITQSTDGEVPGSEPISIKGFYDYNDEDIS